MKRNEEGWCSVVVVVVVEEARKPLLRERVQWVVVLKEEGRVRRQHASHVILNLHNGK
jgi:hypothetical protein